MYKVEQHSREKLFTDLPISTAITDPLIVAQESKPQYPEISVFKQL